MSMIKVSDLQPDDSSNVQQCKDCKADPSKRNVLSGIIQ